MKVSSSALLYLIGLGAVIINIPNITTSWQASARQKAFTVERNELQQEQDAESRKAIVLAKTCLRAVAVDQSEPPLSEGMKVIDPRTLKPFRAVGKSVCTKHGTVGRLGQNSTVAEVLVIKQESLQDYLNILQERDKLRTRPGINRS